MKTYLFAFLSIVILTVMASAQTATPPAGSGTAVDPYMIATLNNLYWVTQDTSQWKKIYKQTADIDALPTSGWDGGKGFFPMGNATKYFTGSYDGQSYSISNLFINRSSTGVPYHAGLFGLTAGATFKNIKLINVNITGNTDNGSASVGALVGYASGCTITNCSSSGSVASPQTWAGIGGLIGYQEYATAVTNCSSSCNVSGTGSNPVVGGLVGAENLACTISTSFSTGTVSVLSGSNYPAGGLVGEVRNGVFNAQYCTITNCYSTSKVTGGNILGGLVGTQQNSTAVVNCFSAGAVTGGTGSSVGGLVGLGSGTVSNSFWDTQTSGRVASGGGTGKTTADMKIASTFVSAGWSGSIWNMGDGINNGYPYLKWQNPGGTPLSNGGPGPSLGTKAAFSNLVNDISENHQKVNIRFHRSLVVGNVVHAVWCETDTIDSGLYKYLAYRRSIDGGRTFDTKKYLGSFTKIAEPKGAQFIAVDGAYVHIILLDLPPSADPVANRMLYFRSTDNGATFESPKTIWSLNRSVGNIAMGEYYIIANGGIVNIYASMNLDYYNNSPIVACYSSADNGATFTQSSNLTLLPEDTYFSYRLFSDAVNIGPAVYALASDFDKVNSNERLTFIKSTDGGKTFSYTPVSIANGSNAISDLQWNNSGNTIEGFHHKKMSVENNDVHIIWDQKDIGAAQTDLIYRKSVNGGIVFSTPKNLTSALARDDNHFGSASITSKGNYVYITYNYYKNFWKIGLFYSKDKGETFSFADLMLDTLFYAQDGRNATPMIDPSSIGDQLVVAYAVNQTWNQKIGLTRFNAATGTIGRKYYFPTSDFSYMSAPSPVFNTDGSINAVAHGSWPGMYAPRRLYSLVIEKEKSASPDNYAVRFDHVTDSQINENIQIPYSPNLDFSSAITIEGWVKKLSSGQLLLAGKKGKNQDYNFYLGVSQNTNAANGHHPFARIATTVNIYDLSGVNADSLPQNRWQHLAMTYDMNGGTNNFKLYLNGKIVDQKTATGTLLNGPGCIFVNHMPENWWSYPMGSALYDEIRFWKKARTTAELQAAMNIPLVGNETDLAAYYPLNGTLQELTGKGEDGIFNYTGYFERTSFPSLLAVDGQNSLLPVNFSISQNYPNPFNPATTIRYGLPVSSIVSLKVYNVLGQMIAELVNGEQSAGWKYANWNAAVPTGVYFYRIEAADVDHHDRRFVQVKKMLLLK